MSTSSSKRILVVDDDDMNREVMEAFLTLENHTVILANNGGDGLRKAAQLRPDLVILDVKMPDMSGYEVCQRLKNQASTSHIPVMIVTGFDAPEDRELGKQAGADAFLARPFNADDLIGMVSQLLGP